MSPQPLHAKSTTRRWTPSHKKLDRFASPAENVGGVGRARRAGSGPASQAWSRRRAGTAAGGGREAAAGQAGGGVGDTSDEDGWGETDGEERLGDCGRGDSAQFGHGPGEGGALRGGEVGPAQVMAGEEGHHNDG